MAKTVSDSFWIVCSKAIDCKKWDDASTIFTIVCGLIYW